MISHLKNEESGYSLVEVLAAIMLLSLAIIPMAGMFDAGLRAALLGGNYDSARTLANSKLEDTKSLRFSDALVRYPEGGTTSCDPAPPAGSPFTCNVQTEYMLLTSSGIDPASYETTMARVTVTVSWDTGGPYTTTGLISR